MDFTLLRDALSARFAELAKYPLFVTDVDKDLLWDTYLNSFPEGSNPIHIARTDHDCSCCRHFIKTVGGVVAIIEGQQVSIWDFPIEDENYATVVLAMDTLVAFSNIVAPFYHYENKVGTELSRQQTETGAIHEWTHFYVDLPNNVVKHKNSIGELVGKKKTQYQTARRAYTEIKLSAVETVMELMDQKSLYRGDEYKGKVLSFHTCLLNEGIMYAGHEQELNTWCDVVSHPHHIAATIRNSAIGTLLIDLSADMDLEAAVGRFESVVAPANYKRPTALITQRMIDAAQDKIKELGALSALPRRYAMTSDIHINNVLFADRSAQKGMVDAFDSLLPTKVVKVNLGKMKEISIDTFVSDVLPHINTMELLVENKHTNNLMSLIAPMHDSSLNILQWDNNFTWTYNNDVTDSMKERVKAAGGKVDGVLRFSLQWNDVDKSESDLDAHCYGPNNEHIFFNNKHGYHTRGKLDVDIIRPDPGKPAVENITWAASHTLVPGNYTFKVHNFANRSGIANFNAEIECGGVIHEYSYPKAIRNAEYVEVATVHVSADKKFTITNTLDSAAASREIWGVNTAHYQKVNMLMLSPNHWDGNNQGNKHYFFILDNCLQPGTTRGFYNEFLSDELHDHHKVFEVLGSKMKVPESNEQLSGLGFSSTQRNHVYCKVSGSFRGSLKIIF